MIPGIFCVWCPRTAKTLLAQLLLFIFKTIITKIVLFHFFSSKPLQPVEILSFQCASFFIIFKFSSRGKHIFLFLFPSPTCLCDVSLFPLLVFASNLDAWSIMIDSMWRLEIFELKRLKLATFLYFFEPRGGDTSQWRMVDFLFCVIFVSHEP